MVAKFPPFYWVAQEVARIPLLFLSKRQWTGQENLPAEGAYLACGNHVSRLDAVTFMHYFVDQGIPVVMLAKASLFRIPVIGHFIRWAGMVPVYRRTDYAVDALRDAKEALAKGNCVGMFPEGTLTRDPDYWPMTGKTGAARLALETRVPVIPVANWGSHIIKPPYSGEWHIFPRTTIKVHAGEPVYLEDLYGKQDDHEAVREATARIMQAITNEVAKMRPGENPPEVPWDMKRDGDRFHRLKVEREARLKPKEPLLKRLRKRILGN